MTHSLCEASQAQEDRAIARASRSAPTPGRKVGAAAVIAAASFVLASVLTGLALALL